MALNANTAMEVQTGGADTNGGGFVWDYFPTATYKWTVSGSGTDEYYVQLLGGGDPSLSEALSVFLDGNYNLATNGTVGSLAASTWDWGDNDSLGYSTVYVRLAGGEDPDSKGDGFVGMGSKGGQDYSQQTSAQLTLTDAATSGTGVTTLTSATGGFTAAMIGNLIYLASGTNATVSYYEITARTDTNTVTLDRSPDDGVGGLSGGNIKVGGALGSPGMLSDVPFQDGNIAWIKSGTYTLSTTTAGAAGALVPTINKRLIIEGYETTRGDDGARPVLDASAQTSFTVVTIDGSYSGSHIQVCRNIKVDGQTNAGVVGFEGASGSSFVGEQIFDKCEAVDCVTGFNGDKCRVQSSIADNCSGDGFDVRAAVSCTAKNGAGNGFLISGNTDIVVCCLSHDNNVGFSCSGYNTLGMVACTAEANASHGFVFGFGMVPAFSCLATNNGGYGFETDGVDHALSGCAGYNNTSGNTKHTLVFFDFVALTADPYVAVGSDDYRPNNTTGGGAELRAAGVGPIGQTNNTDIGAVQHADPAGGGAASILGGGNLSGGFA